VTPEPDSRIGNRTPAALVKAAVDSLAPVKAILAAGGLLLYFVLRAVYVSFYGTLGMDPADASHGRSDILESAALGLATWTILLLATTTLLITLSLAKAKTVDWAVDARVARAALSWTLIFIAFVPLVAVFGSPAFLNNVLNVTLVSITVLLLGALVAFRGTRRLRPGAVAATILLLLSIVLVAQRWGEYQASRALAGLAVRPIAPLSLLNIRVEFVCLRIKSDTVTASALRTPRRVGYLGTRDSFTLLLIPGSDGGVLRVPSSSVVSMLSGQAKCA
jgi:hypothetical protein